MEGLLFVLDIALIILLMRGLKRAEKAGDPEMIGLFQYAESKFKIKK